MYIVKDEFDTKILQKDTYKIVVKGKTTKEAVEAELKKIASGFISCFTPVIPQNVRIMEDLLFHLISVRNTYVYTNVPPEVSSLPNGYSIESFSSVDHIDDEDVRVLAGNIHAFSRYGKDDEISKTESMQIYIEWVKNSLYHGYARHCLIAWYNRKPIGLCTLKIKKNDGYIDLLGVLPQHQDKKIGKQLLLRGIGHLQSENVASIAVVTEGENVKANTFYQKNNFIIQNVELVYHRHIKS